MEVLNEILKFLTTYTTQMFLLSLAFVLQFRLRKRGIFLFVAGGGIYLTTPYIYQAVAGSSFYTSSLFMIGWYSASYVILCAVLFVIIYYSFRITGKEVMLALCVAYLMQNIIFNLAIFLREMLPWFTEIIYRAVGAVFSTLFFVVMYLLYRKGIIRFELAKVKNPAVLVISVSIVVLLTVISQWHGSLSEGESMGMVGTSLYTFIASALLLTVLLCVFNGSRLRYENSVINELLKKAEKQQKVSKDNIDYINMKVHDLKHQIAAIKYQIGTKHYGADLHAQISELEKTAKLYDDTVLTGNNILDSLLVERKIYCKSKNIQLDYVIDGSLLSYMEPVDLYVMLGNALDNAAESVLKINEADKRIVTIYVGKRGKFVSIRVENSYCGEIQLKNGLPVTSKREKNYHGFGIKSIKYIVAKYGGNVTIELADGRFCLSILIPYRDDIKQSDTGGCV